MRPRDSQRAKLIKAEQATSMRSKSNMPAYSMEEAIRRCEAIQKTRWWKSRYQDQVWLTVETGRGKGPAWAYHDRHTIVLPTWARQDVVLLHEMAHFLTDRKFASHGREFALNFLQIVRRFMGRAAYDELKASFIEHKVHFKKKAARPDLKGKRPSYMNMTKKEQAA